MLSFSYWLLKPSKSEEVKLYNINFDESVLGLNIDSAVKYRGISVGKVTALQINPNNIEQVEVRISILKTTPIKEDTLAKLTSQGITGLSYINLSMGSRAAKDLMAAETEEYPVIKTTPSFFESFETSLGSVSTELSSVLHKTNRLLNDKNQEDLSRILHSTASLMEKLDKTLDEDTIKNVQMSIKNINEVTNKIDELTPQVDAFLLQSTQWENKIATSFDSIMGSYTGIKGSMDEIKRAVASGEFNIKDIAGDFAPGINNTMSDMQELLMKVGSLVETYDKNPADILFKEEVTKKGPGE
ncbi:MCE family protein [Sulfurimonas sp. SAG-AH-194-I05]|nr:MCE family protein [Sulfurimonas sp. SAG-AH-194-I05]